MKTTRTPIATINNSNDEWMTVYYNGSGEYMTAERGETVELIEDGKPESVESAVDLVSALYPHNWWMTRGLGTEANYRVLPEYQEHWGDDVDIIVTGDEIVRLAREWDVTIEALMEQVEEV